MAYSENLLPKSAAYYSLNRAKIEGSDLIIEAGGYAEIAVSHQMLPKLTTKMLVVVHPSVFSDYYVNEAVQVSISVVLTDGSHLDYLVSASETSSGVFNAELEFPDSEFSSYTYRIYSAVPVTIYNWELCQEETSDITTVIDGIEQTLPKLLYDYNTYSYAVAQNELTVGLISCFLQDSTDLQGHFTISFFATERCNVHVRVKDNNVTELFSPQVFTVEKGYASISIPHAYLKKTATDHAFSVSMQCSNGQLSIPVRGMLYTIDGGYLATRLLDASIGIEDISIKQLSIDNGPSEIWAVGFESNRIILKSRVYSQLNKVNWSAVKDFGEAKKAAVEFPGRWTYRVNSEKATLDTEAQPFVFIIGLDDVLRVYSGLNFDTVLELDRGVDSIAACQGFNSMYDLEQDQGLIVAYIKEGNVYYRQYLYDSYTDKYMWYPVEILYDSSDATFVSVHRLPDYRLGICMNHASGTTWYITDRTYVSQAVKPEIISPLVDTFNIFTVIDTSKVDQVRAYTLNEFSEGPLYFNNFVITYDSPLVFLKGKNANDLKQAMKVYVNNTLLQDYDAIKSITIVDNVMTVTLKEDVFGGKTVKIEYDHMYIAMLIYNGCYMAIPKATYSWSLPLPIVRTSHEEATSISVSPSLTAKVTPLTTTNIEPIEPLEVAITPTLDAQVKALTTVNKPQLEPLSVVMTPTLTLAVTQTGTSPI